MSSILSDVGSFVGGLFGSGGSGLNISSLLGGLASSELNPTVSQTQPGAYSPPSGSGEAYNYIPTGQGQTDANFQNLLGYQTGTGTTATQLADPALAQLLNNMLNNPSMAGVQPAANAAGQMSAAAAPGTFNAGGALNSSIMSALPQFAQVLQQGTDPQNALYNRTLQQVTDQQNSALANMGLSTSPAGAGIAQQGISNFNIDWQNQRLARALSAIQGFSGAEGQAGSTLQAGTGQQNAGIAQAYNAGQLPYQATTGVQNNQQSALTNFLNSMGGSQNLTNQNLGQMLAYLQQGTSANTLANNVAAGQATNNAGTNAAAAAGLSPLIQAGGQGLGSLLTSLFSSGGGGQPASGPPGTGY